MHAKAKRQTQDNRKTSCRLLGQRQGPRVAQIVDWRGRERGSDYDNVKEFVHAMWAWQLWPWPQNNNKNKRWGRRQSFHFYLNTLHTVQLAKKVYL